MRFAQIAGIFVVLFITFAGTSSSQVVGCSRADEKAADKSIDPLGSWKEIHFAYMYFKACDDGGIAEGYSDGIAKIMANHWTSLPRVKPFIKADPAFETWFIRHLDETNSYDDSMKIDRLARTACPRGMRELCIEIHEQIRSYGCDPQFPKNVACEVQNLEVK